MRRRGDERAAGRERVADLLVDHFVGQAEFRDLAAHHAAGARIGIEHDNLVADRRQIARDRQRRRPRPDAGDPLAVPRRRRLRQQGLDVLLPVGRDPLQPADGDRLLLEASPPAGGLARAVAGAAEDAGKDVRLPVDQIGAVMVALRDPADVFRDRRVSRAGPLAVDDLMVIVRIGDVGRLHCAMSSPLPFRMARASRSAPLNTDLRAMFKKPA